MLVALAPVAQGAIDANADAIGKHDDCPYAYVRVTVRNTGGTRMAYSIESNNDYSGRGRIAVEAPPLMPGDTRVHNLPVPFLRSYPNFSIIDSAGNRQGVSLTSGYSYSGAGKRFLNIAEVGNQASPKELEDFTKEFQKFTGVGATTTYAGTSSTPDYVISQIEPRELPDNWMCYAPFNAVFVRQNVYERMLTQQEHSALERWVEAGGFLSVYAADAESTASVGLGTLEHRVSNPVTMASTKFPDEWRKSKQFWQQFYGNSGGESYFPYSQQKPGGRTGAFFIATLFLILAGPINYFHFKRRGRIRMLMVSMPAISLGFCLLISGYFVGTQGFARRGGTVSLATLDESTDHGFAFARSCLYSGLYPLGGFRFPPETVFLPLKNAENYDMDISNATILKSGIFLPTTNFHYFTATPFQTRERLIYDPKDQSVINGFEKPVESVVVENDGKFLVGGRVPAGGKITLSQADASEIPAREGNSQPDTRLVTLLAQRSLSADERRVVQERLVAFSAAATQKPGTHYAVLMVQNPAYVQTGVRIDAQRNANLLVGVIDPAAETKAPK
jgi:hypothetical protein